MNEALEKRISGIKTEMQGQYEQNVAAAIADAEQEARAQEMCDAANSVRQLYNSFLDVGFSESQAWELLCIGLGKR